jgi:hypothetical protein
VGYASDYASCLVSSDLQGLCTDGLALLGFDGLKADLQVFGCFFVGYHERSVMCRLMMLIGNVRLRLVPRLI